MKPTCNAILLKKVSESTRNRLFRKPELWVEKNSIADIATIRVLTKQTIYAHFVQLIQTKAVSITEVLPEDKIQTLA
jgi:hypothetical protein